jgi:O-acetyl-ADP-ribose deacetylase (regulator of RNase III)
MPFQMVRNDITKMEVNVIVNAANTALKMGGGVCGAIFSAAGARELQTECDRIGRCETGKAVITSGGRLPAKNIIHTVGPIWNGGKSGEAQLLHDCYINSMELARQYQCESIAFPLISSGIYGYPKDQALQIAVAAISEFLLKHEMMVYLVVFDRQSYALSEKLFAALEKFIDDHYVEELETKFSRRRIIQHYEMLEEAPADYTKASEVSKAPRKLDDIVNHLDETFSRMLLRLIDEKGLTDVETYKRANIDRKLFSKIKSNQNYQPAKPTAIAFAIALRLNLDETRDLLGRAGYALSHSSKFDVVIEYFIESGNYDIFEINEALFHYELTLLGA